MYSDDPPAISSCHNYHLILDTIQRLSQDRRYALTTMAATW
jgi:hypothetical protein